MKTILFSGGDIANYAAIRPLCADAELIVCCDSGLRHAHALNMRPHYILGDFDSVAPALLAAYEAKGVPLIRWEAEKDHTDTDLALRFALAKGASDIVILGAMGGRFDHALANCHLLLHALRARVPAVIADAYGHVRLTDSRIDIAGEKGGTLSLMPITEAVTGITTAGLRYPLDGDTLTLGDTRGVSNVLTGSMATIAVESGVLAVILARD